MERRASARLPGRYHPRGVLFAEMIEGGIVDDRQQQGGDASPLFRVKRREPGEIEKPETLDGQIGESRPVEPGAFAHGREALLVVLTPFGRVPDPEVIILALTSSSFERFSREEIAQPFRALVLLSGRSLVAS